MESVFALASVSRLGEGELASAKPQNAGLRAAAEAFEAAYLAEMLAHAGLGASRETLGGGAGEDAFASLLTREWAARLVASGGVGLADAVERALAARAGYGGGAP